MQIEELNPDPYVQFQSWFQAAVDRKISQPEAMSLATVGQDLKPRVRTVLFKGLQDDKFSFFTNYDSEKSKDLKENPKAGVCFFWEPLARQILIEGPITLTSAKVSDDYWRSRPRNSQLSAWASPQSRPVKSTLDLQNKVLELEKKFAKGEIPRPANWGGYLLYPERFEFWQGREHRLHERFIYLRDGSGWRIEQWGP